MAPAAQMLAMPNRALRRAISQAKVVTMRPPVADHGCPDGDGAAGYVDAAPVHGAGRSRPPALFPGHDVGQDLGGEGLVNLDQVDLSEAQAASLEKARHDDAGGHQQSLTRINGAVPHGADEGKRFAAFRRRAVLAYQQHGRSAIGDRRGVTGRDRAARVEGGLQVGQGIHRRFDSRPRVVLDASERKDLPGEPLTAATALRWLASATSS